MTRQKERTRPSEKLFAEPQPHMFDQSYEERLREQNRQPVECLGMTFPNDEARRQYFLEKLRQKLQDPEFRKIEGFPNGSDEDILSLSNPPYYTACPNPFIEDFIRHHGKPFDPDKPYNRKPFAVDVSEGKTDPIYKAHSYHTKVPHLAIVPSILHYTEPGDVVLDGFCGSGMTGVAMQWCGAAPEEYRHKVEGEFEKQGLPQPKWGVRRVVLNDLSPAATFIAANYNLPFDIQEFAQAGKQILREVEQEIGWMYETRHLDGKTKGRIEYTVWSEVFNCPDCSREVIFLDEALDKETKRVKDSFPCPHCGVELTKTRLDRFYEASFDPVIKRTFQTPKKKPVIISYTANGKRYEKAPDEADLKVIEKIAALPLPSFFPSDRMMHAPDSEENWGDKWRAGTASFSHVHHLFLPRAAHALAKLWRKATAYSDSRIRHMLLFFIEQALSGMSILNRYRPIQYGRPGGSQVNGQMTGVYYVASQISETSPWYNSGGKLERLIKAFSLFGMDADNVAITTGSATNMYLITGLKIKPARSRRCLGAVL